MTVEQAHTAVSKAEAKLADAEHERDNAYVELDNALAAKGWRRATAITGNNMRLYAKFGGGDLVPMADVVNYELAQG
jgi:hypothetical protein